ncbi:hypothetical protein [Neptunomonas japonica]|uniref:hypothetical protein n=1 Tax=Neptunomonas japonica TaxID=417574 RepID=UPI000411C9C5|nr:hypothetical protein [Neptunomonas japonica]
MNALASTLLVLSLSQCSGCFYWVTEGQGGVAERFPITEDEHPLASRLLMCEQKMQQHTSTQHRTERYQIAQQLLIQSRRLYDAELLQAVDSPLQQAETLIRQIEQEKPLVMVQQGSGQNSNGEICL